MSPLDNPVYDRRRAALSLFTKAKTPLTELSKLQEICNRFALACGPALKQMAGVSTTVTLDSLQLSSSLDHIYPALTEIVTAFIPEWNEQGVCHIERPLLFSFLNLMYGGDPGSPTVVPDRPLTPLERALLLKFSATLMMQLRLTLEPLCAFSYQSQCYVEGPEPIKKAKGRCDFLLVRLKLEELQSFIVVGIPATNLELCRDQLEEGQVDDTERDMDPNWSQAFRQSVTTTRVALVASADGPPMLLSDVAALQPGSILEFEGSQLRRVLVESGERPLFVGRLGKSKGVFTICIEDAAAVKKVKEDGD